VGTLINLVGRRFGKLTVLRRHERCTFDSVWWECQCDCGKISVVIGQTLREGRTKSCGCGIGGKTHGLGGTYVSTIWSRMVHRCYDTTSHDYYRYGGRGIRVCEFLRATPANLIELLGHRPTDRHSVDRRNNDGSYTCGQCAECLRCGYPFNIRWATKAEQARNTRRNRWLTINGVTKCSADWADEAGIKRPTFCLRLKRGLNPFTGKREHGETKTH